MILSFHPIIVADKNIICAGRDPGPAEEDAIRKARAIILPQGCRQSLYDMATRHCSHVFPNYDTRFEYPGKIGQIRLFKEFNLPHPKTKTFSSLKEFYDKTGPLNDLSHFSIPFVFKFDWGGEGDNVFLIDSKKSMDEVLTRAGRYEKTGQHGFLIQEFIPAANRSLRVVCMGQKRISYWRLLTDPDQFIASKSKGAVINKEDDPAKQKAGIELVDMLCKKTGINLAGIDILFSETRKTDAPLLLEINYFFGRSGLGGSERFYELLNKEVKNWINRLYSGANT